MYPRSFIPDESVAIADGNYIFPYFFQFSTPISEIVTYTKAKAEIDLNGVRHYKTSTITKLHIDLYPDLSQACEAPTKGFPRFSLKVANPLYQFLHTQPPTNNGKPGDGTATTDATANEAEVKEKEQDAAATEMSKQKKKHKRFKVHEFSKLSDLSGTTISPQSPCEVIYENIFTAKSKVKENIRFSFTITKPDFFQHAKGVRDIVSVVTKQLRADDKYKDYTLDRIWTNDPKRRVQITIQPLSFKKQLKLEHRFMKANKLGKYSDDKRPQKKHPKKPNKAPPSSPVCNCAFPLFLCCITD